MLGSILLPSNPVGDKAARTSSRPSRGRPPSGAADPEVLLQFSQFAERTRAFSREVGRFEEPVFRANPSEGAKRNLEIVRTIFSKWNPEILAVLYGLRGLGFEELRRILGSVSAPVLSRKLRFLHEQGLIHRTVLSTPVIRVQYSLTDRGLMVAQLGEPVLLYLRMTDGMFQPKERFVGRESMDDERASLPETRLPSPVLPQAGEAAPEGNGARGATVTVRRSRSASP